MIDYDTLEVYENIEGTKLKENNFILPSHKSDTFLEYYKNAKKSSDPK
jgi:hypothetical protein